MDEDPLAPSRGCFYGLLIGCATWGAIALMLLVIASFFGFAWSTPN